MQGPNLSLDLDGRYQVEILVLVYKVQINLINLRYTLHYEQHQVGQTRHAKKRIFVLSFEVTFRKR